MFAFRYLHTNFKYGNKVKLMKLKKLNMNICNFSSDNSKEFVENSVKILNNIETNKSEINEILLKKVTIATAESFSELSWYKFPAYACRCFLEFGHYEYDVPWWICVIGFSIFLRMIIAPISLKQNSYINNTKIHMPTIKVKLLLS